MTNSLWFSSKVRLVCLVEPKGATRFMESVFLFRAADFESAFIRALELGRRQEQTYANADHQTVWWKLASVISLDQIGPELADGVEVYSEPVPLPQGQEIPFHTEFAPEQSRPTQTV